MSDEATPLIPTTTSSTTNRRSTRNNNRNMYWTLGCVYGASAVAIAAYGAHGLKKIVPDPAKIASFGTAAHYQLIHSLVLLLATRAAPENKLAANLFTAGMTMFSGSVYALVLDPARFRFLGPVTPLGGLCLMGGWVALAF
ncbi:hypothetical protein ANO14919_055500 [Xylariales sp. No.14919]|nr:hypothetical protein F5X98DRAFT_204870 [Xylaria grammica]GAW16127.1 hypothetical protein ANO14919_055500 [Xylariales sp. No.14919]